MSQRVKDEWKVLEPLYIKFKYESKINSESINEEVRLRLNIILIIKTRLIKKAKVNIIRNL